MGLLNRYINEMLLSEGIMKVPEEISNPIISWVIERFSNYMITTVFLPKLNRLNELKSYIVKELEASAEEITNIYKKWSTKPDKSYSDFVWLPILDREVMDITHPISGELKIDQDDLSISLTNHDYDISVYGHNLDDFIKNFKKHIEKIEVEEIEYNIKKILDTIAFVKTHSRKNESVTEGSESKIFKTKTLGDLKITVVYKKSEIPKHYEQNAFGYYSSENNNILILFFPHTEEPPDVWSVFDINKTIKRIRSTILHELRHAMQYQTDFVDENYEIWIKEFKKQLQVTLEKNNQLIDEIMSDLRKGKNNLTYSGYTVDSVYETERPYSILPTYFTIEKFKNNCEITKQIKGEKEEVIYNIYNTENRDSWDRFFNGNIKRLLNQTEKDDIATYKMHSELKNDIKFGLPSKKLRNQKSPQQWSRDDPHYLRDIEFQTNIGSDFDRIKEELSQIPTKYRTPVFKLIVGGKIMDPMYFSSTPRSYADEIEKFRRYILNFKMRRNVGNKPMMQLKKENFDKWKKAVKEIYKELSNVMNMGDITKDPRFLERLADNLKKWKKSGLGPMYFSL